MRAFDIKQQMKESKDEDNLRKDTGIFSDKVSDADGSNSRQSEKDRDEVLEQEKQDEVDFLADFS